MVSEPAACCVPPGGCGPRYGRRPRTGRGRGGAGAGARHRRRPTTLRGGGRRLPDSGLTHLTAVSGTNLTLVLGALMVLARAMGARAVARCWSWACWAWPGSCWWPDPNPRCVRAASMGTVALLGMGAGGRAAGVRALGVAMVLLLLVDPRLGTLGRVRAVGAGDGRHPPGRPARARRAGRVAAPLGRRRGLGAPGGADRLHAPGRRHLRGGQPGGGAGERRRRSAGRAQPRCWGSRAASWVWRFRSSGRRWGGLGLPAPRGSSRWPRGRRGCRWPPSSGTRGRGDSSRSRVGLRRAAAGRGQPAAAPLGGTRPRAGAPRRGAGAAAAARVGRRPGGCW